MAATWGLDNDVNLQTQVVIFFLHALSNLKCHLFPYLPKESGKGQGVHFELFLIIDRWRIGKAAEVSATLFFICPLNSKIFIFFMKSLNALAAWK